MVSNKLSFAAGCVAGLIVGASGMAYTAAGVLTSRNQVIEEYQTVSKQQGDAIGQCRGLLDNLMTMLPPATPKQ